MLGQRGIRREEARRGQNTKNLAVLRSLDLTNRKCSTGVRVLSRGQTQSYFYCRKITLSAKGMSEPEQEEEDLETSHRYPTAAVVAWGKEGQKLG